MVLGTKTNTQNASSRTTYPKGTMFQAMGKCAPVHNFYDCFLKNRDENLGIIHGNLRGNLSAKVPLEELREQGIEHHIIGSVSFTFHVDGTVISILLFNKGSCKICGGFPKSVVESGDVERYKFFFRKCMTTFEDLTALKLSDQRITCLNGQFKLNTDMNNILDLDDFVRRHRSKFAIVKPPNLDNPGRRGAYKLYLVRGRKTHIAVDYKGTVQVFACKSFEELFRCFRVFY